VMRAAGEAIGTSRDPVVHDMADLAAQGDTLDMRMRHQPGVQSGNAIPVGAAAVRTHCGLPPPLPERKMDPVDQAVRPDPDQPTLAGVDLAYPGHTRP